MRRIYRRGGAEEVCYWRERVLGRVTGGRGCALDSHSHVSLLFQREHHCPWLVQTRWPFSLVGKGPCQPEGEKHNNNPGCNCWVWLIKQRPSVGVATHVGVVCPCSHLVLHELHPQHQSLATDVTHNLKLITQLHHSLQEDVTHSLGISLQSFLLNHLTERDTGEEGAQACG